MQSPSSQQRYVPKIRGNQLRERTSSEAFFYRIGRIWRNLTDQPIRAFSIAFAVALGVSIAITIIAASDGIEIKINALLDTHNLFDLQSVGINLDSIHQVLIQTRILLTTLAIGFTAALVSIVTTVTFRQRRREIGIKRQDGERLGGLLVEMLGKSLVLCILGGGVGILLGHLLCYIVSFQVPLLPLSPSWSGVIDIFPWTTLLSFLATAVIAVVFAIKSDTDESL